MYAEQGASIHLSLWPEAEESMLDAEAEQAGEAIFAILGDVRRFKSERKLSLGAPLTRLSIRAPTELLAALEANRADLHSATRAGELVLVEADELATSVDI